MSKKLDRWSAVDDDGNIYRRENGRWEMKFENIVGRQSDYNRGVRTDKDVTEQEILWRLKGYLDCLRGLSLEGAPDPKYVLWICEKTGEPLVSLSYLEDLRRKLGAQTAGQ